MYRYGKGEALRQARSKYRYGKGEALRQARGSLHEEGMALAMGGSKYRYGKSEALRQARGSLREERIALAMGRSKFTNRMGWTIHGRGGRHGRAQLWHVCVGGGGGPREGPGMARVMRGGGYVWQG